MPRCPVCGKPVTLQQTPAAPFCGERCRQIDLGRWLDEHYSLPVEGDDEPDQDEADRSEAGDEERQGGEGRQGRDAPPSDDRD